MDPNEASELLAQLNIGAIPPPAKTENTRDGYGSLYQFDIRPPLNGGAIVYRYDVEIKDLSPRNKSLTSGGGDDGKKGLLRSVCIELLRAVSEKTLGEQQIEYVYDSRKILFTNKAIVPPEFEFEVAPNEMTEYCRQYLRNTPVKLEIKPCQTESYKLDLNNLKTALQKSPAHQADRSIRTFLELLTSQTFINADTHDIIGMGRLFEKQIQKKLGDGIVTRNGLAKGVRIIVDDGIPKAALVADVKNCAFFEGGVNLESIVKDMMRSRRIPPNQRPDERFWRDFNELFHGVNGYLTYAPSRIIAIDAVTNRVAGDISFDVDGRMMTIVQFFQEKKGIRVDPNLPVVRQQNDKETLFPLSTIIILPNQRVNIGQMTEFISRELLNANTIHPQQRFNWIEGEVKKIATGAADFMKKFGVVLDKKNEVKIGVHKIPQVKFGAGNPVTFGEKISPAIRYVQPSTLINNWIVGYPRKLASNANDIQGFVSELVRMGTQKGMKLPKPNFETIELNDLPNRMDQIRARKEAQFLMYIDNKMVKSHQILKLNEKRYNVLTQHVTYEVAMKARAMTLSNVLNKMNMKTFGFNYTPFMDPIAKSKFNMDSGEVLVIGFDTSRPPKASAFEKFKLAKKGAPDLQSEEPMVVGISANYDKNPYKFLGDYYFQPCRQDVLEPSFVAYKVKWVLDKVVKNRSKLPSTIFVIRDGISEGMVPNAVCKEFPAFLNTAKSINPNWQPKFIYSIVDKKHNKRFFLQQGGEGKVENTVPGCVVDKKFTRPDLHEFWLQSHVPLKGTAKIPQYFFPVNQVNAINGELQAFLLMLCNNWQIVNLAPSLPTPVRLATELAKRGRNNYIKYKRTQPVPRLEDGFIDYQTLNGRLSYNSGQLGDTRFNA